MGGVRVAKCIECGREVPDGALFCEACGRELMEVSPLPQERKKAQPVALKPAVQAKQPVRSGMQLPNGIKILIAVLALLAAAGVISMLRQVIATSTQRAELRVREQALTEQESEYEAARQTAEDLRQQLSQAQLTVSAQQEQIAELQSGIAEAQSSVNQTQYDMTAQRSELERLQQENASLTEQLSELDTERQTLREDMDALTEEHETLKTENETLTEEKKKLSEENQSLKEKSSFMDSYVVFVEDDKSGLYHKYGCSAFKKKSFWAYSRKLAENFGYSPCPKCFE